VTNDSGLPPRPPHVVWVCTDPLTDALPAIQWLETTRVLRELGWRVTLVAPGPGGPQRIGNVEIVCIPQPPLYMLRQVVFHLRLLRFVTLQWSDVDIVLFHHMTLPWALPLRGMRVVTGQRGPLLVMDTRDVNRVHLSAKDRIRGWYYGLAQGLANRWVDGQTAITQRMAELQQISAPQLWGVWPSGVTPERFAPARSARRWPSGREPVQLAYIGDLNHDRNLLTVCRAVEQANDDGMAFRLTFVGGGWAREDLEQFARETAGRVRVLPPVPHAEVPALLAEAHVGLTGLPRADDAVFQASSPLKLLEYMAAGLPVLAPRNPCYTDVIRDGGYAFWAEEASQEGLVAALRDIWRARAALPTIGAEAAAASSLWTWEAAAHKLKVALEHGLAAAKGPAGSGASPVERGSWAGDSRQGPI
jgi:glycosyltransferase involved in cell wall biosynthesis